MLAVGLDGRRVVAVGRADQVVRVVGRVGLVGLVLIPAMTMVRVGPEDLVGLAAQAAPAKT